jgi:hypothetical protein
VRKIHLLVASALLVSVGLVGCGGGGGGGGKTTTGVTKAEYASALDEICKTANHDVAALRLTTAIGTWKKRGNLAVKYVQSAVRDFRSLTPPDALKGVVKTFNDANDRIASDIKAAAKAAKAGNQTNFHAALGQQRSDGQVSNAAAAQIGATACA